MRASITADTADIAEAIPSPSPAATPATPKLRRRSWLGRLMRRPEPTLYHRCLAIHIATATEWDATRSGRSEE